MHDVRFGNRELLLAERQDLIMGRLAAEGRVIASDLAAELRVSEDTIRRDLREMAARGLCDRVYGGALPVTGRAGSLSERTGIDTAGKAALACAAVQWVGENAVLFLDAASSNLAIAQALPEGRSLTCVTNAPRIAAVIADRKDCEVIVIGGTVDHEIGASVGAHAVREAAFFRPDVCFLGACGVDAAAGVTAFHAEDAEFKRIIAARSGAVVVPVTNAKLGRAAPYCVMPVSECSAVIVEQDAAEAAVAACREAGAMIEFAG
ncbi:DeoR/GlpR family DNA-binding transcription regulator [Oricola cellulosilytica]|uniref:DeoR/GlpR transcriptional regulator n=1 Tax=Oricola cellulosilytica TaxID=1429082 RepID=A0A4R0P9K0_9HYPH|nr:DeoR/GlpR family DNA-binding transcription regulator [Oricola cellulosilytica]TCD13841.1 DeoR/GlpR transcriptional regulator [Oricola cellulosilytica]